MISTGMSSVAKSKAVSLPQSGINIALEKPSSLKWQAKLSQFFFTVLLLTPHILYIFVGQMCPKKSYHNCLWN